MHLIHSIYRAGMQAHSTARHMETATFSAGRVCYAMHDRHSGFDNPPGPRKGLAQLVQGEGKVSWRPREVLRSGRMASGANVLVPIAVRHDLRAAMRNFVVCWAYLGIASTQLRQLK